MILLEVNYDGFLQEDIPYNKLTIDALVNEMDMLSLRQKLSSTCLHKESLDASLLLNHVMY